MKIELNSESLDALTFQDYKPQPDIAGVVCIPLKKHMAIEGSFMEFMRLTDGYIEGVEPGFDLKQISFAKAIPGRINAFHVHPKEIQDELWCVVDGVMMVWLADIRSGSPTEGAKRRFVLSGDAPHLLYIPSGVAHGYKAGPNGALLVYAMNSQFNINDPNEGRLPWDFFGSSLWEEDRG
ncbi:MAG: dTDP-4-dehydrorhamnose 3,5-epimerase family protein [Armatimonadota bacterium]